MKYVSQHRRESTSETNLQGKIVTLADIPGELDHGLHTLDLALDDLVEVLLFNRREGEEVDGADVACLGIFGDEFSHPFIGEHIHAMVWQRVSSVSNSVLSAATVSSSSSSPFNRLR